MMLTEICISYEEGGYFILRGKERVIIPQKNLGKNTLFITNEDGDVIGTLHACLGLALARKCFLFWFWFSFNFNSTESVDAPRVVNKFVLGYDKEIFDTVLRVQVNQIYAAKGVPLGVMTALLGKGAKGLNFSTCHIVLKGMTDWNVVVDTIAAFAQLDVAIISKILKACETEAATELKQFDETGAFEAAWLWLSEKVSAKQRMRTLEPLPQHPPESKRNAAQEVVHPKTFDFVFGP